MKFISIFFLLFLIISCKKELNVGVNIAVSNFSQVIEMDSIVSDISLLKLNVPDTNFIGQIKDVAICNDSIYILDDIKQSLFIFDIHGNFIQEICRSGRGKGEYINAFSLECDSLYVYVLDMTGKKLLRYDRLLNFVDSKNIPYTSSDFKVIDKQFVFNNIEDIDGNFYYTFMDSNMKIINKLIPFKKRVGHTLFGRGITGQMITQHKVLKNILLVRPFSNHVYKLTTKGEQLLYEIDFGRNTIPEYLKNKNINLSISDYIYIEDFFDLESTKVISFFEKDKRYYCLFSPEMEVLYAGKIKDSKTLLPFFPRWQYKNKLIGTCRGEYVKKYLEQKDQKINLQDTDKSYLIFYSLKSKNIHHHPLHKEYN